MPDRYTYPGSDVLVNKFGVTDYDDWKDAEVDFIGARMGALREHPIHSGEKGVEVRMVSIATG